MNRIYLILFVFLFAMPLWLHAQRPNLILILTDDQGYGDLSAYGAEDMRTPHMDGLIEQGIRFDQFYANSSVCSPTRAAILTGRFPDLVGVPGVIRTHDFDDWGYLSPDALTLPQLLRRHGYHTSLVGKWHLGLESPNTPLERGFDHFHGFLCDMLDDFYEHRRHGINYMRRNNEVIETQGRHATELITEWSVDYIHSRASSPAPFFLFLSHFAPHSPIQPPQEWVDRVMEREPGIDEQRAHLVALIEHMDDGIGEVIAALKQTGAYDNSLIIFTSDNGGARWYGSSNGPLRGSKSEMYEGGLRVPMGAVWPGQITPGQRTDYIAATMDIFPTFIEAAGGQIHHTIDGVSLLPVFLGKQVDEEERVLVFMRREGRLTNMGQMNWALRQGDWKLLQNLPNEPMQLFNLRNDPGEQVDLIDTYPDIRNELARLFRLHMVRSGSVPWKKN